jgi:hypothetical protein
LIVGQIVDHGPTSDRLQFAAAVIAYKQSRQALASWLPHADLTLQDPWKQRGFYVGVVRQRFQSPTQQITRGMSEAVVELAKIVVLATADYGLQNIDSYLQWAAGPRARLTPDTIRQIRTDISDAFGDNEPPMA